MDWDLDKGEILKTYKNEFDWLKTIFFMKKGIRDHFWKVSSDLKPFWQVTIFHTRLPHKPNHGLGLRQGWNSENFQKWVWLAQNGSKNWIYTDIPYGCKNWIYTDNYHSGLLSKISHIKEPVNFDFRLKCFLYNRYLGKNIPLY